MYKKQDYLKILPNLLTFGNLACGFTAIIIMSEWGDYITVFWIILLGGLFDALDGAVARLTNTTSQFGIEIDSLADIVSFGTAPAFILYSFYLHTFGNFGIVLSILLVVAGGFRLARFNAAKTGLKKDYFEGMPIPLSALTILSYIVSMSTFEHSESIFAAWTIPLVLLLSLLMVSKFRFHAPPKFSLAGIRSKPFHFIFLVAAVAVFLIFGIASLFFIFVFVILIGIFQTIVSFFLRTSTKPVSAEETQKEEINNVS